MMDGSHILRGRLQLRPPTHPRSLILMASTYHLRLIITYRRCLNSTRLEASITNPTSYNDDKPRLGLVLPRADSTFSTLT
jgi:hypothetical protein